MYAIYGNMDPINIPQMLAYIPYMDPMVISMWVFWSSDVFSPPSGKCFCLIPQCRLYVLKVASSESFSTMLNYKRIGLYHRNMWLYRTSSQYMEVSIESLLGSQAGRTSIPQPWNLRIAADCCGLLRSFLHGPLNIIWGNTWIIKLIPMDLKQDETSNA